MLIVRVVRAARIAALGLATLAFGSPALGSAFRNDNTGLYNAVGESGWAVAFEQQGDAITATIYTYESNGQSMWYSATLFFDQNLFFLGDSWIGDLYATTGPWFGAPFDASKIAYRKVGTLNFIQEFTDGGVVNFTIDGVAVSKHIQRWTFRLDDYTGTYRGLYKMISECGDPRNPTESTSYIDATITITQAASSLTIVTNESTGNSCTYTGDYRQSGQVGESQGRFVCTNGLSGGNVGAVSFYHDMNVTPTDFRGQISGVNSLGCELSGNVVGIRQLASDPPVVNR
jgi:hypothetical protein